MCVCVCVCVYACARVKGESLARFLYSDDENKFRCI